MKHLLTYLNEALYIMEGGNAIKDAEPIPAFIAPIIYDIVAEKIKKYDSSIITAPLGSCGKKFDDQTTGDIDIAINLTDTDKLKTMLRELFPDFELADMPAIRTISIGYKYDIKGYKNVAQVDFMYTDNIEWTKWRNFSPDFKKGESKYKGALRDYMFRKIFEAIPVKDAKEEFFEDGELKSKWRHTFTTAGVVKQLLSYVGKSGKRVTTPNSQVKKETTELVSNNPKEIMAMLCGNNVDEKDFNSGEGIWKAIHDPKKFLYGKDVVAKFEEMFYKEFVYGKSSAFTIDPFDFPCQYYDPTEIVK